MNTDQIQIKSEPSQIDTEPEPGYDKCSVCLQQFSTSQSYTSTCRHSFCFECLLEWSRIKYNCPLCKRPFDRIIFAPTGHLELKEFILEARDDNRPLYQPLEIIEQPRATVSRASWVVGKEPAPLVFRMLVYLKEWYAYPKQCQTYGDLDSLNKEFNDTESLRSIIQTPDPQKYIIYKRVRRFRDISCQWLAHNPACTHRLMNFIHRELKALACVLKKSDSKLPAYLDASLRSKLMEVIIAKIKTVDIVSLAFLDLIKKFVPVKFAKPFQHELESYAKSTSSTLADYDSKCVYYCGNVLPVTDPVTSLPSTLPVNMNKYRLHYKPLEPGEVESDNDESVVLVEEEQMSDTSSFCEEVEVPERAAPECIVISSSRSRSSSREGRSGSRSGLNKEIRRHLKKLKTQYRSRSKTRVNETDRSRSDSVRRTTKATKSTKKKHRKNGRSESK